MFIFRIFDFVFFSPLLLFWREEQLHVDTCVLIQMIKEQWELLNAAITLVALHVKKELGDFETLINKLQILNLLVFSSIWVSVSIV